jgi:hypothetical protein
MIVPALLLPRLNAPTSEGAGQLEAETAPMSHCVVDFLAQLKTHMGVPGPLSGFPGRPLRLLCFSRGVDGAVSRERSGMVRYHRGEDRYKTDGPAPSLSYSSRSYSSP